MYTFNRLAFIRAQQKQGCRKHIDSPRDLFNSLFDIPSFDTSDLLGLREGVGVTADTSARG